MYLIHLSNKILLKFQNAKTGSEQLITKNIKHYNLFYEKLLFNTRNKRQLHKSYHYLTYTHMITHDTHTY